MIEDRFRKILIKALGALQSSINKNTDAINEQRETNEHQKKQPLPSPVDIKAELSLPVAVREYYESEQRERPPSWWRRLKGALEIVGFIAAITAAVFTYKTLGQIHSIVSPLTFNVPKYIGPIAEMIVQDTIENVGAGVAVNVFSWEDIIPLDATEGFEGARKRQNEVCDDRRRINGFLSANRTGLTLFPHDPIVQTSHIGPPMTVVAQAMGKNKITPNAVGFALAGCVAYRSTLESTETPAHETKFIYYLGVPEASGVFNPMVKPSGSAPQLQLIMVPDGFTAD